MEFIRILVLFFISLDGKSKLPVLTTKQTIDNLRFISRDGKYTYYQRRSGSLVLSTNYSNKEVIKGQKGTSYNIVSSFHRKKLLIVQKKDYHSRYRFQPDGKIFILDFGGAVSKKAGEGLNPRLHLKDTWLSFFNSNEQTIYLKKIDNLLLKFEIKLNNKINPYFIPHVIMLNEKDILYTDLNREGVIGIVLYDRQKNKMKILHKTASIHHQVELCLHENLYIGIFPMDMSPSGSSILKLSSDNLVFSKGEKIYESTKRDLGNIICDRDDKFIYFVQNQNVGTGKDVFEAVRISLKDRKIDTLSDVKYASQIIQMDGRLLLPWRGDFYILE